MHEINFRASLGGVTALTRGQHFFRDWLKKLVERKSHCGIHLLKGYQRESTENQKAYKGPL